MTEFLRAMTRPAIALMLTMTLCVMVYQGKTVPLEFYGVVAGVFGWWFWDRSRLNRTVN